MELAGSGISQKFVDLFRVTFGLNEDQFERLLKAFHKRMLPKKHHYLSEGEVTRGKAYINKGCTRTYVTDENGKEHILFFAFEDWWVGDFESYHTQKPGRQFVQALEDCELLCVSRTDFSRMAAEIPNLNQWDDVKAKKMIFAALTRLNEVKTLSAEERYLDLLKRHPTIFQRVSLQYIAAFLDIAPQSLSRMRRRLVSK